MSPLAALSLSTILPKHASWQDAPDIVICAEVDIPQRYLSQSLTIWKDLGHSFSIVYLNYDGEECHKGYLDGSIIIAPKQTRRGPKAHTYARISQTHKRMIAARIEIDPSYTLKSRVLTHELGHALGWSHSDKTGHLMHPIYQLGGWRTTGLHNHRDARDDLRPKRK